jgi:hypothetical protein
MKLAIIVPYRDRRDDLDIFLPHMVNFLTNKQIEYNIYIIEQFDEKPFNYGKLCNVGVNETIEQADYFCFHDVNVLPINDDADYSYKEKPTQLFYENSDKKILLPYDEFFGGVVVMNKEDFLKINGFNNNYWGKGYVDLDLLYRCEKNNVPLIKQYNYKNDSSLNLDLKNRCIIKKTSKIVIDKHSIIACNNSDIISKNYTLSFHYKENTKNKGKLVLFRTYGENIMQMFSINKQLIFQFFYSGEFFQFEITDVNLDLNNHYTITHNYINKEFNVFVNGIKIKTVNYKITYNYNNKTVAIGDKENKAKIELYDFKIFDKILTINEIIKNYYYGIDSNFLAFNNVAFYKNTSNIIDKKLNIWEILAREDNNGKLEGKGAEIFDNYMLKLNSEIKLPNRLKGKYRVISNKFVDIENTYDPDILQNRKNYYEDTLSGKVDSNKYGFKSLKYTFLNKEKFDRNVIWIKVLL